MTTITLEHATEADFPAIIGLVNLAYRGKGEHASWNVETGIVEGTRIDDALLREDLAAKPNAHLLICRSPQTREIIGTVWLDPATGDAWYLGLFTVTPALQKQHLGRELLSAAENFARARGARSIRMSVLCVRDALIAWYLRRGYRATGEREPFPYGDNRFGTPLLEGLEFVILEKRL